MTWKQALESNGWAFLKKCNCSGWGEWWQKDGHRVVIRQRLFKMYKAGEAKLFYSARLNMQNAVELDNGLKKIAA